MAIKIEGDPQQSVQNGLTGQQNNRELRGGKSPLRLLRRIRDARVPDDLSLGDARHYPRYTGQRFTLEADTYARLRLEEEIAATAKLRKEQEAALAQADAPNLKLPPVFPRRSLFTLHFKDPTQTDEPDSKTQQRVGHKQDGEKDEATPRGNQSRLLSGALATIGSALAVKELTEGIRPPESQSFGKNFTVFWGSHAVPWTPSWLHPNETIIDAASAQGDLTATDWPAWMNDDAIRSMRYDKLRGDDVVIVETDSNGSLSGISNYAWLVPHLPLSQRDLFPKYFVALGTETPSDFDISSQNFPSTDKKVLDQVDKLSHDLQTRYDYNAGDWKDLEKARIDEIIAQGVGEGVAAGSLIMLIDWLLRKNPKVSRRKLLKGTALGIGTFELLKMINEQGMVLPILQGEISNPDVQNALIELESVTNHPVYGNYLDLKTKARTARGMQLLLDTQRVFPQIAEMLGVPSDTKGVTNPHAYAFWGSEHSDPRLSDEAYREGLIKAEAEMDLGYADWAIRHKYPALKPYSNYILATMVSSFTLPGASLTNYPWGVPDHITGTPKRVLKEQILSDLARNPKLGQLLVDMTGNSLPVIIQQSVDYLYEQSLQLKLDEEVLYNLQDGNIGVPDQSTGKWVREVAKQNFGVKNLAPLETVPSSSGNNSHYLPQLEH